jgi:hypothetical protein
MSTVEGSTELRFTRGFAALPLVFLLSACHGQAAPPLPPPLQPGQVVAVPDTIDQGGTAILQWNLPGATSVGIDGLGYFSESGVAVSPFETRTYLFSATGSGAPTTASVTVKVRADFNGPLIEDFQAAPATLSPGGSAVLSWSVQKATSLSISGIGEVTGSSITVSPKSTTSYVLTAKSATLSTTSTLVVWMEPETDPAILAEISGAVSAANLRRFVEETSGVVPVTVGNETFSISERFSPAGKARFRAYWAQYFATLGLETAVSEYPTEFSARSGEPSGHTLEAVLPGASPDSVVLLTHYDSTGTPGVETANPGADDNMSGMAQILEAARILTGYPGRLRNTVRFVAADNEEYGERVEGANQYAYRLKDLAAKQGFRVLAAIDPEQSGWNCGARGLCPASEGGKVFEVSVCDDGFGTPSAFPRFDYRPLQDQFQSLTTALSPLTMVRQCTGNISDHFPFAQLGIPAVMYSERLSQQNPYKDQAGDTVGTMDFDYLTGIARVGIPFMAQVVGISNP